MSFLVLTQAEVEELLPMRECIDAMEDVLVALHRGELHQPLRMVVRPPGADELMVVMPTHRGGQNAAWGLKVVCISPGNPALGLDAHQGAVVLFDGETGEVRAMMNASAVTAIRTAAVSGVATRLLAHEDARELAVIGAGVQARSHLEAMAAARPFERARVYARSREHSEALASSASRSLGLRVEAAPSAEGAVRGADVVVTATSSPDPVLDRGWLSEGAHVNAVGACLPTIRELDTATVAAARLVVDRRESALSEAGDVVIPIQEGAFGPEHIAAELGEIASGDVPGRTSRSELTVFESLGLAVEDLAAAQLVLKRAEEAGAGTRVEF
jgi:ornithine cyclodeaminase/alanine dehydrogenase-like protein (mu-crystallin family)